MVLFIIFTKIIDYIYAMRRYQYKSDNNYNNHTKHYRIKILSKKIIKRNHFNNIHFYNIG